MHTDEKRASFIFQFTVCHLDAGEIFSLVPTLLRGNAYPDMPFAQNSQGFYDRVWVRDEAEIKVPRCAEFLFVVFVAASGA